MEAPCVRVPREDGEAARSDLAERDLIDPGLEIVVDDGWLYVPVEDPDVVPDRFEVVTRDVPARETQDTPADLLGFEPSYERLGDVVILDEDDPERARRVADAVMASDLPVDAVLNKASKVKGRRRVRDWEVLACQEPPCTETVHREYGSEFALDVAEVYFSPRLATERHRVAEQVEPGERAFDMFAGVGPFVVPFARRGAECVGVDVNERAVAYLRENARRNGVEDRVTAIVADVREVAAGTGGEDDSEDGSAADYRNWADRIVMNLPHSADEFLDSAVALAGEDCVVHYYDIQHEDDPFGPGERAIRAAAGEDYDVEVLERRVVRSYAPHELNVCLDVRLRRRG
ncbi:MAG: class I SAM-dependent methyltransferase family protein [Halobacteriales archaeon]